jgi:hypothetical protein
VRVCHAVCNYNIFVYLCLTICIYPNTVNTIAHGCINIHTHTTQMEFLASKGTGPVLPPGGRVVSIIASNKMDIGYVCICFIH